MDSTSIEIRPLSTQADFTACVALQRETWGEEFSDIVPPGILKVSQRVGGIAAGAFDADTNLLGFVFGLTGVDRGRVIHWSDMLAVRPEARNIGLGRRLKEYQRHAVRDAGAVAVYWTYDPLIARNAHLNFNKLGVHAAEYVDDMYGTTDSLLHGGIPTDRLVVAWPTRDEDIDARLLETKRTFEAEDCRDAPVVTEGWIAETGDAAILPHCVRVAVPSDAESMLTQRPSEALAWRHDVRYAIRWALGAGYSINGFYLDDVHGRGYYLFTKQPRVFDRNGASHSSFASRS